MAHISPHEPSVRFKQGATALLLALFLTPFATSQELDAEIRLGDQFKGAIIHNSDIDVLRFSALQSSLVTVTIKSTSKMKPDAAIVDAVTGAVIDTVQFEKGAGSKTLQLKKVPLPATGTYDILITTNNGKFGKYTVKTAVKYPNTLMKVKTFIDIGAGETKTVPIFGDVGSKIVGSVKGANGSTVLPSISTLNTPAGPTDITGFVVTKGKKLKIKKLFLNQLGQYGLEIQNVGTTGSVFVDLEITPEKVKKITWKEPNEPTDPGSISGTLTVADLPAIPETEPNDSIADAEFVGLTFPGKIIRTTGTTSDNGFPGGQNGQPTVSADLDSFRVAVEEPLALHFTLIHGTDKDFDIGLWDVVAGQWVGFVETAEEPEVGSISVNPQPDTTLLLDVIVFSYSGTGSYILTMNAAPPPAVAASDEENGQQNVPFRLNAPLGKDTFHAKEGSDHYLGLDRDFVPGEFIVRFHDDNENRDAFAAENGLFISARSPTGPTLMRFPQIDSQPNETSRRATVIATERLRNHPLVKWAELNYIEQALAIPNDPSYAQQWHYPLMQLPQAWDVTKGSSNIIVAVLDTGTIAHPDLVNRDSGTGIDMIVDPNRAMDGDGIDMDPTDVGDKKYNDGSSTWHGAHVAGTIGAQTNNGSSVSGVDWNCKLMHIRVLGKGGGSVWDIAEGIKYAAGIPNASGKVPPKPAKVINMSLGGPGLKQPYQDAIDLARNAGSMIVAASGNSNSGGVFGPAGQNGVICVGAVGEMKERAAYSNFGAHVDVVAPGGDGQQGKKVLSTTMDEKNNKFGLKFSQGTSMAAPHVAGLCSLILSANPTLSPDQVEQLLKDTAEDLGAAGKDDLYGHGLTNAFAAVKAASAGATPSLSLSTQALDFGKAIFVLDVIVSNNGAGNLTWNATDTEENQIDWITLSATTGGPSTVDVNIDRGVLLPGIYKGKISFTSNGGNAEVAVQMEVGPGVGPPVLKTSTESLNFGTEQNSLTVQLENLGGQSLNWNGAASVVGGGSWLTIAPPSGTLAALKSQAMTVSVNRTGLAQGAYSGAIAITSNGGNKTVAVNMNVAAGNTPILSLSATTAHFGATKTTVPISVANAGGGALNFTASDAEVGGGTWLNATPTAGTAPSVINITVDRTGLNPGNYSGTVSVASNGGNETVTVQMEVLPKQTTPINLGNIYILAVDPITLETHAQTTATQFNGAYSMFNVPVGLVLMVAGPDLDNDGVICGVGEPCGFYPTNPDPLLLTLTSGQIITGVDFSVTDDQVLPGFAEEEGYQPPVGGFRILSPKDP